MWSVCGASEGGVCVHACVHACVRACVRVHQKGIF